MLIPHRFALADEAAFRAFLAGEGEPRGGTGTRVVVLFRGVGCPYSATFEHAFMGTAPPEGWTLGIRLVEEGGHGPVAEALRVHVTPTVVAFADGSERARLDGKLLLGITRATYARWLKTLA